MAKRLDFNQFTLNWEKAKRGTFTPEERETLVCSNMDGTAVCSSEPIIIAKIIRLYHEQLDVKVVYFKEDENGSKIPTEVKVMIPKKQFFGLRSIKESIKEVNEVNEVDED